MSQWFWCKFGATLYRAILTIFTISNGILKTQRDNLLFLIYKNSASAGLFVFYKAVLFTFGELYGIITLGSYLLDKLEFDCQIYSTNGLFLPTKPTVGVLCAI